MENELCVSVKWRLLLGGAAAARPETYIYILFSALWAVPASDFVACMCETHFTNTWAFLGIFMFRCAACGNVLPNFVPNSIGSILLFLVHCSTAKLLRFAFFLFSLRYSPSSTSVSSFSWQMNFSSGVLMPSYWIGVREALVFQVFQMQHIKLTRTKWNILIRVSWVWVWKVRSADAAARFTVNLHGCWKPNLCGNRWTIRIQNTFTLFFSFVAFIKF